ncbi:hypothetical protein OpiT1DRAFT_04491 [Opitutaceae bacterium TAV1]|nr:hypothetical protein OpiT1DRAFT_04491 [Opitutaceae bacterium TAV1]
MSPSTLKAALYLEVVPGVLTLLSGHDEALAAALAGPAFGIVFAGPHGLRARLAIADGAIRSEDAGRPGDLRLRFMSAGALVRAFENRPTFALPLGGWRHLRDGVRRFGRAGERLRVILDDRETARRDPALLALHAWGSLAAGLAAATAWLRHHPDGAAERAQLGEGAFVFDCDALPAPLWIHPASLRRGAGEPPGAPVARVEFAHVPVLFAELGHRLDALAALGTGELRITGRLPLVDRLSAVINRASALLRPLPERPIR